MEVSTVERYSVATANHFENKSAIRLYAQGDGSECRKQKETRPFLQVRSTIDKRTTQQCRDLHMKVFAIDDPI